MNRILWALLVTGMLTTTTAAQTDWYVDAAFMGAGNGSQGAPFTTIQPAVAAALTGDTIHVAPGVYGGTVDFAGKGLVMIGDQGPALTFFRASPGLGNSLLKIFGNGAVLAHVQGFTFDATGSNHVRLQTQASTLNVWDCVFKSQGIDIIGNNLAMEVDSCLFDGTFAAIRLSSSGMLNQGSLAVLDSEFKNAFPYDPDYSYPAIVWDGASITVINCNFHDNGQGINCYAATGMIKDSVFQNHGGTGLSLYNGAVENCQFDSCGLTALSASGYLTATDCSITNSLRHAMSIYQGYAVLERCRFEDNGYLGQLIEVQGGGSLAMTDCIVVDNDSYTLVSGANSVALRGCVVSGNSGGIQASGPVSVESCSFVNNTTLGSPLLISGQALTARNSIFRSSGPLYFVGPTLIESCNVEGGWSGAGQGNVDLDPLFVDAANGDLHLQPGSPMIDAGTSFLTGAGLADFEGDARVIGRFVDIGADEYDSGPFALVGTKEDFGMVAKRNLVRVNGTGSSVTGGNLISLEIQSPAATFVGAPVWLFGELFPTGGSPILPVGHPGVHLNLSVADLLLDPVIGSSIPGWNFGLPTSGIHVSGYVPYGLVGNTYRLQAFTVWPTTLNGWYAASEAVDLDHM